MNRDSKKGIETLLKTQTSSAASKSMCLKMWLKLLQFTEDDALHSVEYG